MCRTLNLHKDASRDKKAMLTEEEEELSLSQVQAILYHQQDEEKEALFLIAIREEVVSVLVRPQTKQKHPVTWVWKAYQKPTRSVK